MKETLNDFLEMWECAAEYLGEICEKILDKFIECFVGIIDFLFLHETIDKRGIGRVKKAQIKAKKLIGVTEKYEPRH